jgi:putative ABC transport system substrate-binding protein
VKPTMFRRAVACVCLLLAVAPAAQAQEAARVYRIGLVAVASAAPSLDAFRRALRELGYFEEKNIIIEARFAEARSERLPQLIAESIAAKVDVLVVGSTPAALAAKRATTTVPIVFAALFDPVGAGIVPSLARPGGNITGASIGVGGSGLAGKWVQFLKEAVPGVSRVAVLANSANPAGAASVREVEAASRSLKVKLDVHDAANAETLHRALAKISAGDAQGLIVTNDPFFTVSRDKLVQFAASKRLPAVYFFSLFADAGGLMVYAASLEDSYRSAAKYVDKILRGAKPADLPIEQPTRFELVLNMRTARALGLTIPHSLVARADRVID